MGDKRIPITESNRDALKDRKRGDDTYDDVIERLLDGGESDVTAASLDEHALAQEIADLVAGGEIRVDSSPIADAVADRVDSPDTVSLEASERRAIAEEVVGMLR